MMDLSTMNELQQQATIDARELSLQPKTFTNAEIEDLQDGDVQSFRDIPNLGQYRDGAWKRYNLNKIKELLPYPGKTVDNGNKGYGSLFCDASGFGSENEPALTQRELRDTIIELHKHNSKFGFGIVYVGQFQIEIGVFE